ncbi:MAG: Epoxyqueuosine (oQ) reductase QueG [Ignavibacteriae bacterium]|nr:MAG: Epoxyqueuosine (oQ) reductase QueG [Ignavibacteriota bacterium]
MSNLKTLLTRKALDIGINKIGFTNAQKLVKEAEKLREWLSRNFNGEMQWMQKSFEKRVEPSNVLPDVKSIIVCAINYYTPYQHSNDKFSGKISRYAWGDDYHIVLKKLLVELLDYLKSIDNSVEGKVYVDTGPVMEKVWAQRSGIGWIGKHTNLITRDYGSWVFLGVILTNIEIENDEFHTDLCGSCTRCIDACPTDAIVAPYVLDSNKCISYLTIEHKGEIDESLIPKFDNWIYGCDICQDVCPWNKKFAQITKFLEFYPRKINFNPNLFSLQSITLEDFRKNFKNSPIKRIKLKKYLSNVNNVLTGKDKSNESKSS